MNLSARQPDTAVAGKLAELGPETPEKSGVELPDDTYKRLEEEISEAKAEPKKKQEKPGSDDDEDSGEMDDIFAKLKELDD